MFTNRKFIQFEQTFITVSCTPEQHIINSLEIMEQKLYTHIHKLPKYYLLNSHMMNKSLLHFHSNEQVNFASKSILYTQVMCVCDTKSFSPSTIALQFSLNGEHLCCDLFEKFFFLSLHIRKSEVFLCKSLYIRNFLFKSDLIYS